MGSGGAGGDEVPTTGGHDNAGGSAGGPSAGGVGVGGMGVGGTGGGCDADLDEDVKNCGECGRACLDEAPVKTARCIGGVCQSFCKSGFVNMTMPATGPDDGCETPGRRVFVTQDGITAAEVGGISNADAHCQTLADEAELGGAWAAWLSEQDESSSPSVRFNTMPDAPYMLLDFTQVAESWTVLLGGNGGLLDQQIDLTETMMPASNQLENVWTGTTAAGLPSGSHCTQWTAEGKDPQGTVGSIAELTSEWTELAATASCGGVGRLYCFEQ